MDQLRATFIAGPQEGLTAQETFTNRVGELEAFRRSLEEVERIQREAEDGRPSLDITRPRRNVLVYYGIGGIGKTTLSKEIERAFLNPAEDDPLPMRRAAVRLDFGESGDVDVEAVLLQIRAGLSRLSRKWAAFDLAFSLYWARAHPGQSLPDFIRDNSALRRYSQRTDFVDQLQDTFGQVLTEIGLAWGPSRVAVRIAALTHERLSQSLTYRRLAEHCPFFEPIAAADASPDALSYMASLLAWEFDGITQQNPALAVIFLDTFEAVSDRDSRELERLVQRLVYLNPAMLHVVTTRNRLDWAEMSATSELDYVGTSRWPRLHLDNHATEPRQHLVGALSPADCEGYLRHVLTDQDGSPALSEDLRTQIIEGSEGLPLYLDLSVTHFLELRATRRPIAPEMFGGSLSSIVTRIMRHLNTEERNILRGVSFLDCFDIGLAHAASRSSDATIRRFVNSSLVLRTSDKAWPYAVHAQLRRMIQEKDHELRDAWSDREWSLAAERVCTHLGEVSRDAQSRRDRTLASACLSQAVRLCLQQNTGIPAWVFDVAQFLADAGAWSALDVRLEPTANGGSQGMWLVHGLRGIALRRSGSLEASVESFDRALAAPEVESHARELLRLHRTHSLRNSGQYGVARAEYAEIAQREGEYAVRARLQLADISLLTGQFTTALRTLDDIPQDDADVIGEAWRIKGHVHRANCDLDSAELIYRRVLELGHSVDSAALEGKALTNLAETLCWRDPAQGRRFADEAIDFNNAIGNQLEVIKAYAAKAVASTGEESAHAVEQALKITDLSRYRAGGIFALVARLRHQARDGDESARDTARGIGEICREIGVYHFWAEIADWWLGEAGFALAHDPVDSIKGADWMGLREVAQQRWIDVLKLGIVDR